MVVARSIWWQIGAYGGERACDRRPPAAILKFGRLLVEGWTFCQRDITVAIYTKLSFLLVQVLAMTLLRTTKEAERVESFHFASIHYWSTIGPLMAPSSV